MTTGTSSAVRNREARVYLDGVAAELADLPQDDRADLLDELAAHVDELVAETDVPLPARLGSPAEYAAELRASAGLPPAQARGRAGARVRERFVGIAERRQVVAIRGFLGALRPFWWVLRAWVVVGIVAMWPGQTTPAWADAMPLIPRVGTPLVGLVVLLAVVVASVQLGRRGRSLPTGGRRGVLALNVVAAVMLVPVLVSVGESSVQRNVYHSVHRVQVAPTEGVYASGSRVRNIYAYDASGTLLHDVRLYDQDGLPVSLGPAPDGTRKPVVDGQGRLVENAFPYRYVEPEGAVADPDAGPSVDVPPLAAVVTPTPAPSASSRPGGGEASGPSDGKR